MAIFTAKARPGFQPNLRNKSNMDALVVGNIDLECVMSSNLAYVTPSCDPKGLHSLEDFLLQSPTHDKVRKCPNTQGNEGSGTTGATTEAYTGVRSRVCNPFSFSSPRGVGGGQGNGDDEDDEQITDYKKKWLGCDGLKRRNSVDKTKWGPFKSFQSDKGNVSGYRLDCGKKKSNDGRDECDASMAEQAVLLQKQWTNQLCPRDQVVYTTLQGTVVAFVQRLFGLWIEGSIITPSFSEGVIYNQNLTLNSQNQYRFGEEFVPFAELGRGDFGTTHACQDWRSGMKIATKEIPRERFLPFEVLLLAKLRSPFIVRFLGATAERSALYLHMELIDNALQLEYLAGEGAFLLAGQDRVVNIAFQLLAALDCLYSCKVLHRDLTCRNVLLTVSDKVKVIDFNLAVPAPYEQTTMPVGDIHYLAPEVTDGVRVLTCSSDLWSCGIILIALLRGLPQDDDCERMALTDYHPLHCSHISHCHPDLHDLLQLMLAPDPRLRPQPSDLVKHRVFTEDLVEELEACPARVDSDSPDHGEVKDHISGLFQDLYLRNGKLVTAPPEVRPSLEREHGATALVSSCQQPPGQHQDELNSRDGPLDTRWNTSSVEFRPTAAAALSNNPPFGNKVENLVLVASGTTGDRMVKQEGGSGDPDRNRTFHGPGAIGPLSEIEGPMRAESHNDRGPPLFGVDQRSAYRDESDCRIEGSLTSLRSRKERRLKSHRVQIAASFSTNGPADMARTPSPQRTGPRTGSLNISDGISGDQKVPGAGSSATANENNIPPTTKATPGMRTGNHMQLAHRTEVDRGTFKATGGRVIVGVLPRGANNARGTSNVNPADTGPSAEPKTVGAVGGVLGPRFEFESAPQTSLEQVFENMELWSQLGSTPCAPPPSQHYAARGPNAEPLDGGRMVEPAIEDIDQLESIVFSQAMDSYSARQNLCDGPYQYPEEWLNSGGEDQLSTVEASEGPGDQGGEASELTRSSSHESSFRGAHQDEEALASEILMGQLSMDTDPELQDRVYQQFTSGSSAEPSLT